MARASLAAWGRQSIRPLAVGSQLRRALEATGRCTPEIPEHNTFPGQLLVAPHFWALV